MTERTPKKVKTDGKGVEIVSKGEMKTKEIVVLDKVLFVPEVTLHWVDAVTKIADRRRTTEDRHLKQELIM